MNYFSQDGGAYKAFRPVYDVRLADTLAALTRSHKTAVDVGCGNGQLASLLAARFERVLAIDPSESQLAVAYAPANVFFERGSAEQLNIEDDSADLIVAAQAAHWFDLRAFYAEVHRVAREHAVIALMSYAVPSIQGLVNAVFEQGYWGDLHQFWPPERRHVETGYADLPFPFEELPVKGCGYEQSMTAEQFIGYMRTWSAFKVANDHGASDQFVAFFARLREAWPAGEQRCVSWPLVIRAGFINAGEAAN